LVKQLYKSIPLIALAVASAFSSFSAASTPSPKEVLGRDVGEDYFLATYEDSLKYFHALAGSTNKMKMFSAGKTTQGRTMEYAVISSPENIANWETYKSAARTLASADGLNDQSAQALASKTKIIVHIDGGMHSDEVSAHQSAIALAYKLIASNDDEEVAKILDNVIVVLWPTLNPDGMTMVVDWYQNNRGTPFEKAELPWLYQEYVGHDNNRDGVMLNMIESQNISTAEQDYSPTIWYSHHQPGPYPARIWMPPFSDPISSNIDPYVRSWTTTVGSEMMGSFVQKQMPGAIAQGFDNWFPGYLDYISAFRHTVSFFTEVAHDSATPKYYDPKRFPKNRRDERAMVMYPLPWTGGWWHLSDSIRYEVVASMSVLDTAMRYSTQLQYDRYQAARDTINQAKAGSATAWVIPSGQADAPEAALLAQKFIEQGLRVERASAPVHLGSADYPAGSWVIPMDQAYAGLVRELLGIQKYPDALLDSDGVPKTLPYDVTGWTLSLQLGVAATEIKDTIDPAEATKLVPVREARQVGGIVGAGSAYALSRQTNASYLAANQAAEKGANIAFSITPVATSNGVEQGAIVVTGIDAGKLAAILRAAGATATALPATPVKLDLVRPARVGLYRSWQASSDEGWTRWVLEQYHFNPTALQNDDVKRGNLNNRFDTIILPDLAGSATFLALVNGARYNNEPAPYAGGIEEAGAAALKAYVKNGGTLAAVNRSADAVIDLFDLPVDDVVRGARSHEFHCAGALVHIELGNPSRATAGLSADSIVIFKNSPAFKPLGGFKGNVLASYQTDGTPVASGIMVHPVKIAGKAAALEVEYGKGRIFLYGFPPLFRGQLHASYKLLFNLLYKYSAYEDSATTVEDDEIDGE
jgi:Zinc carboxypeptidase